MLSVDPTKSEILIQGNVVFQNPSNNIVFDAQIIFDEISQKGFPLLDGAKEDDEYFFAPQEITLDFGQFNNSRVYYNEQDADYIPIVSGSSGNECSFIDDSECIDSDYTNLTNSELFAEYDESFMGSITPDNAITDPMIIGAKVVDVTTTATDLEVQSNCLTLYPNPTNGFFKIQGDFTNYTIQILSSSGALYQDLSAQSSPIEIDISTLPNGLYFIKVFNDLNNDNCIQQIIKMN